MEKQMTLREIELAYVRLQEVIKSKRLFVPKVNLAIARNTTKIEQQIKELGKQQECIVERYVLKGKDGRPETKKTGDKECYIFETAEKERDYAAAMGELEKTKTTMDFISIQYEDLINQAERYDEPTAADLVAIDFMMEE